MKLKNPPTFSINFQISGDRIKFNIPIKLELRKFKINRIKIIKIFMKTGIIFKYSKNKNYIDGLDFMATFWNSFFFENLIFYGKKLSQKVQKNNNFFWRDNLIIKPELLTDLLSQYLSIRIFLKYFWYHFLLLSLYLISK